MSLVCLCRWTGPHNHSTQLHRRVACWTSLISWPLTTLSLLCISCPTSSLRLTGCRRDCWSSTWTCSPTANTARSVCCIWYCSSLDLTASLDDFPQHHQCCSHVDQFVPRQPHSVRPLSWIQVDSTTSVVWSPTGFGPGADALSSIYSRSGTARGILWTISTLICRRHPDLRLLSTWGHWQSMETCCWLRRCHCWLDAFQSTSSECVQDESTVVRFSPLTESATFRPVGCWLWSCVACQMRAQSQYFHWCRPDDAYPSHSDMFEVFCCPSTPMKHMSICVKRRDAVAHRGAGVFQAWLRLRNSCRPSKATHGQASVWAERRCTADFQSLSSGSHSAVTVQITLASDARTYFVPAGSAGVSLPPWLCTWLPGFRSSARVTPQRTSTTALFDYISAGRSTHGAFYHRRPHLSSDCCIGLEQFAGVSQVIAVVASFPQQTENRTFCPVLQSWLTTSHWQLLRDFTV